MANYKRILQALNDNKPPKIEKEYSRRTKKLCKLRDEITEQCEKWNKLYNQYISVTAEHMRLPIQASLECRLYGCSYGHLFKIMLEKEYEKQTRKKKNGNRKI